MYAAGQRQREKNLNDKRKEIDEKERLGPTTKSRKPSMRHLDRRLPGATPTALSRYGTRLPASA